MAVNAYKVSAVLLRIEKGCEPLEGINALFGKLARTCREHYLVFKDNAASLGVSLPAGLWRFRRLFPIHVVDNALRGCEPGLLTREPACQHVTLRLQVLVLPGADAGASAEREGCRAVLSVLRTCAAGQRTRRAQTPLRRMLPA